MQDARTDVDRDITEMKMICEMIRDIANRPTYNDLEVGFRHGALPKWEVRERMIEALWMIHALAKDCHQRIDSGREMGEQDAVGINQTTEVREV